MNLALAVYKFATELRDNEKTCNEVDGVSVNPVPEQIGVANISNEACTSVEVGVDMKTSFVMPTEDYQSLRDYFARPRLIVTGSLPTTRISFVNSEVTPSVLWNTWFPGALTRLAGVHGVRFTLRFTLTVAATPFQQALLAQSFQYGTDSTVANGSYIYKRLGNSAMVTNLPHVRHNITDTTMTVFDVPFLYARDYLPLYYDGSQGTNSLGQYSANALLPYRTLAGANAPTYKLFVSIHDLELIGSAPQVAGLIVVQGGGGKAGSGNPKEAEKKSMKLSDRLSQASKVATIAAFVPALTGVAGPTAIAAEAAARVARAFGYSRPQVEDQPTRVYRNNYCADANVDIPSNSYVLAPMQRNEIRTDAVAGGTDVDEMAMAYVLEKPCQIFAGDFSTTDSVGTTLYGTAVCPTNFWFRSNSARPGGNIALPSSGTLTTNSIYPSTLCYVGSMFRYWRGGLKFTFSFSKTKFHGGRVIVAFVPGLNDNVSNGVLSNSIPAIENGGLPQPFSYCEVFDLRDADTFEFHVPYVSPTLFTTVTGSIGGVTMTVLDPLVSTGETAATVDYIVEVQAEPDFRFGCPAPCMLTPTSNTGSGVVFQQSGLGGVSELPDSVDEYTTGETILSLKSLMMIPSYITESIPANNSRVWECWPYWMRSVWTMITPLGPPNPKTFAFTRSGNIAACYAFVTGSTEHHIYSGSQNNQYISITANERDGNIGAVNSDPRTRSVSGKQRVFTTDNSMHVRVPQYARVPRVPLASSAAAYGTDVTMSTFAPGADRYISNYNQIIVANNNSSDLPVFYGRAAADDARCVGWLGPPPVAVFVALLAYQPDSPGDFNF